MPDRQAEAESRALADAFAANSTDLATKADVRDLRNEISLLSTKFDAKFDKLSWMLAAVLALAAANFAKQYF